VLRAPAVGFSSTGRGSGGWGAGVLEGEERRRPGPGRRGHQGAGRRRLDDVGRVGAAKVFALGGRRLRQGAAVRVVGAPLCFEVRQARARIVSRQMEGGGIGDRKAQRAGQEEADEESRAEPDGEGLHGMECAGSARRGQGGPTWPCFRVSASDRPPSWGRHPSSCTPSWGTSGRGWSEKTPLPGCSSRARRAGRSGAVPPA